jgi:hypothetical protein
VLVSPIAEAHILGIVLVVELKLGNFGSFSTNGQAIIQRLLTATGHPLSWTHSLGHFLAPGNPILEGCKGSSPDGQTPRRTTRSTPPRGDEHCDDPMSEERPVVTLEYPRRTAGGRATEARRAMTDRLSLRRGFLRLWVLCSVVWLISWPAYVWLSRTDEPAVGTEAAEGYRFIYTGFWQPFLHGWPGFQVEVHGLTLTDYLSLALAEIGPPVTLLVLGGAVGWVITGFSTRPRQG